MYTPRFGLGYVSQATATARAEALQRQHDAARPAMVSAPSRSSEEAKALERMLSVIGVFVATAAVLAFFAAAVAGA